jgi:glycosyltransferase involved in cell wall biosynthesis
MSAEKTVLFPWGVDTLHFSPGHGGSLRKGLGWGKNFIILCVRSWEQIYGVDLVLRAFKEALQQAPDLRLLLPGSGSQKKKVETFIYKNDLIGKVTTPGRIGQDQLPAYYRAADLYVSASHSDGSSVSLLEAFACGLPALVSDIPSNLEWVSEGKTGWSFPDGDFHALAEQMLDKKKQSKKLEKMKGDCRKMIVERADWKKNFPQLLRAYEMAMTG